MDNRIVVSIPEHLIPIDELHEVLGEDRYKDLLENKDLRKISSGDFTGVGDKVKEMFSVISNDRVPEASKTIDHIVDANKMIGEFDRVIEKHSRWLANTPPHVKAHITELKEAHNSDISAALKMKGIACDKHDLVHGWACPLCANAKDERISWLEEYANAKDVSVTEEMQRANDAEARITELEAQVQELIEELIEELQDVVCFAPECTTSKEYAVKRLEELMSQYVFLDNKCEAKKMIGEFERVNEIMDEIVNQRQKKIQLDFKRARVS